MHDEDRAVARSRAERYLARAALHPPPQDESLPSGLDPAKVERQRSIVLDAALSLYADLGLVDPVETEEWRRIAAVAATRQPPVPSSSSSPRTERLLAARLDEVGPVAADAELDPTPLLAGPYGRFMGTLAAASVVGELTARDAERWQERLVRRVMPAAARELERRRFELLEIRRVIVGPARRPSGITLTSAELYADACVLRWQCPLDPDPDDAGAPRLPEPRDPTVADDVGTDYASASGSGGTSVAGWTATAVVVPPPPPHARELNVDLGGDMFVVDLGADDGQCGIR